MIEGNTTLYEYEYNAIGYLVEVRENGVITAEYQYDANGNRTDYITPSDTVTATYDGQDRMLSYGNTSYSYGKRGDLQRKIVGVDTTSYNYDNLGNLRSVALPDGDFIEYIIDGQDRRVAKKVNGHITKRWLYAGGLMPIAELDSTGAVEKRYGPGYIVKNDTTYRVIRDHLGSVRMVVNDQTGDIVQRIDYHEYGNITHLQNEDEFTDIGFAGGLYDYDTGLLRFGARDYDPEVGRWTSKDPILFDGGTSNLYEYALNDPVNMVDTNGKQAINPAQDLYLRIKLNMMRAEFIAEEVVKEAEIKAPTLPGGREGLHKGPADAWRHARWNQRMVNEIDWPTAFLAGMGHELEGIISGQPLEETSWIY